MEIITRLGDLNRVQRLKQTQVEKRVLAYIKKVITNSRQGFCCVSQETIRRALGVRKKAVVDALRSLVAQGRLSRFAGENRNRQNEKHYYVLPEAEPLGNSNKSLFISSVLAGEVGRVDQFAVDAEARFVGLENWKDFGRLELIKAYIDGGLMITPLIELGKIPVAGWSKNFTRTRTKNELLDFFANNPNHNVGCWMPKNLIAVDVDNAEMFYELTGGEIFDTLTSSSGRGFHNWFLNTAGIGSGNAIRPRLDYKACGSLMVLPPSIHKSGRIYEWTNVKHPIEAPQLIQEFYSTRESVKSFGKPFEGVRGSSPFITKATVIEEGQRYNQLFRLGRHLRQRMSAEELAAELEVYNKACCRPPLSPQRMNRLIIDVQTGADRKDFGLAK